MTGDEQGEQEDHRRRGQRGPRRPLIVPTAEHPGEAQQGWDHQHEPWGEEEQAVVGGEERAPEVLPFRGTDPHEPRRDVFDELGVLQRGVRGPPGRPEGRGVKPAEEERGGQTAPSEGGDETPAAGLQGSHQEQHRHRGSAHHRRVLHHHRHGGGHPAQGDQQVPPPNGLAAGADLHQREAGEQEERGELVSGDHVRVGQEHGPEAQAEGAEIQEPGIPDPAGRVATEPPEEEQAREDQEREAQEEGHAPVVLGVTEENPGRIRGDREERGPRCLCGVQGPRAVRGLQLRVLADQGLVVHVAPALIDRADVLERAATGLPLTDDEGPVVHHGGGHVDADALVGVVDGEVEQGIDVQEGQGRKDPEGSWSRAPHFSSLLLGSQ